ncbi:MAG: cyclic-di-AMP receptor [Anaerolineae bacterium]
MKLILSIVHSDDAETLIRALEQKGHRCTKISTTGGFLREGNATVLVGAEAAHVDEILAIIRENCHARTQFVSPLPPVVEAGEFYIPKPVEVQIGGATVFVLNVERSEKF